MQNCKCLVRGVKWKHSENQYDTQNKDHVGQNGRLSLPASKCWTERTKSCVFIKKVGWATLSD